MDSQNNDSSDSSYREPPKLHSGVYLREDLEPKSPRYLLWLVFGVIVLVGGYLLFLS